MDAGVLCGGNLYTDNTDFLGGHTRSQDPVYSMQGHAIYGFRSGIWASLDATYFTGGRTTINGRGATIFSRTGGWAACWCFPWMSATRSSFTRAAGVSARTGNDFDLMGVAWQYRWGGGL